MVSHCLSVLVRAVMLAGVSVVVMVAVGSAPAYAGDCGGPLNGTYTAFSDGQWAKTRQSYHDEQSVTATWTVTTTCTGYFDCTGQVMSDQGWTEPIKCVSGTWKLFHDVPNWEPCADGTSATGKQMFIFSPDSQTSLTGLDKTVGLSGACGVNNWLTVIMPFSLTQRE